MALEVAVKDGKVGALAYAAHARRVLGVEGAGVTAPIGSQAIQSGRKTPYDSARRPAESGNRQHRPEAVPVASEWAQRHPDPAFRTMAHQRTAFEAPTATAATIAPEDRPTAP